MVLCEWNVPATERRLREICSDWRVFLTKGEAVDFIVETFQGFDFFQEEIAPGVNSIRQSQEPTSFSDDYRCLEAASWLIGRTDEDDRPVWNATISIERLWGAQPVQE